MSKICTLTSNLSGLILTGGTYSEATLNPSCALWLGNLSYGISYSIGICADSILKGLAYDFYFESEINVKLKGVMQRSYSLDSSITPKQSGAC